MKNLVKLIAPAKVNMVLAVGEALDDGFHRVDTIIHALALHDSLTMRRFDDEGSGEGLVLTLSCETLGGIDALSVPSEENIAYRAVARLYEALGRDADETIQMSLTKMIPAEAGLGGGSSDAAAALLGAAVLWGVEPTDPRVLAVASELGADVAFFLYGGCARLSGKGEVLEATLAPRKGFVLLLRPDQGVSTKEAYAAFDAAPVTLDEERLAALLSPADAADVELYNNMTDAACAVTPAIGEVLSFADGLEGGDAVLLCGSGSAVCVPFSSYDAACAASVEAHKAGIWSRVTSFAPLGAAVVEAW